MYRIMRHAKRIAASTASALGFFIGSAALAVAATTIGTNISTDGTLSVAGNAAFDATTLFVDATNNKVGIGTNTPEARLHVLNGTAGTITADPNAVLAIENSTNAYLNFLTPGGSSAGILFGHGGGTAVDGAIFYNRGANVDGLTFNTDAGDRMVILNNGNVGIGDASPSALFTVGNGDLFTVDSSGNVVIDGSVTFGDATTDTVTFTGRVDSNIVPETDDTVDLGTASLRWRHAYFGPDTLHIGANGDEVQLKYDTTNDQLKVTRPHVVEFTDAVNTGTTDLVTLHHRAATPGSGIGSGLLFMAQDSNSGDESIARIAGLFQDATDGSEVGMLMFSVRDGAGGLADQMTFSAPDGVLEVPQLKIGNSGSTITAHRSVTATVGNAGANIVAADCIVATVTVSSAASGDTVVATPAAGIEAGLLWSAYVSAADTVSIRLCNVTSAAVASADISWRVDLWKH